MPLSDSTQCSYEFQFDDGPGNEVAQIWSVGWETHESIAYRCNGMNRLHDRKCVFHYTLSGYGVLEINGRPFRVEPEHAFLVEGRSNYCYFVEDEHHPWEIVFITLYGSEAQRVWREISSHTGPIVRRSLQSDLIQSLLHVYKSAREGQILDGYRASSMAFDFVMKLYQSFATTPSLAKERWPSPIEKAISFVYSRYSQPISVRDIAFAAGLSVHRFSHLFSSVMGLTPIQFLTKVRVERAASLLRKTSDSVDEIARQVGFSNGNYFCKVFKRLTDSTPNRYRHSSVKTVDSLLSTSNILTTP